MRQIIKQMTPASLHTYTPEEMERVCLCNDEFRARVYIHITVALPFNQFSHFFLLLLRLLLLSFIVYTKLSKFDAHTYHRSRIVNGPSEQDSIERKSSGKLINFEVEPFQRTRFISI